jgi:hypothetical protein
MIGWLVNTYLTGKDTARSVSNASWRSEERKEHSIIVAVPADIRTGTFWTGVSSVTALADLPDNEITVSNS